MNRHFLIFGALFLSIAFANAQTLSTPPNGGNQRSIVTQYIGSVVSVTVDYRSPDVTAPNGNDRKGQIWGQLVPYGLTDLGFGFRNPSPWRAGANENTTITFSHDVEVQGEAISAGTYGIYISVEEDGPWTIYFNKRSEAWGSFFYDESMNVLSVEANPEDNQYNEWLTYEFIERQPAQTTLALRWESIQLPFTISVPNMNDLYLSKFEEELYGAPGFLWQNLTAAANWTVQNNHGLDKGLEWAEAAISAPFVGTENFNTLSTKAQVLAALERESEANETMNKAINHSSATSFQIHGYGRRLLGQDRKQEALEVFKMNSKRFDGAWPTNVGLARGYSAVGKYKQALKYAKIAMDEAPDQLNKDGMKAAIEKLQAGEDFN